MTDRVQSIQAILNKFSIQDAIIAGSSEIKRELEIQEKLVSMAIGIDDYSNHRAATRLGELRTLHLDAVDRIQVHLHALHLLLILLRG